MDHHVHAVVIHIPTSFQEECIGLLQGMSPEEGEVLVRMGAHGVQILREGNITRDVSDLRIEYERKLSNKDQERQMWQEVFTNHQASVLNERVQQFQVEMERYKQRLEASERDRMALERAHIQTVEEEKNKVLTKYEALSHQQQEEWKQLHERWIIAQAELTCSKDTVDLLVRTRVHEVVEERRQDHSRHIDELTTLVETYRTKCQEMEVREQATKVEALHLAMEEQKKEVQEIKATLGAKNRQSSATLGKEGEAYFYELAERTFATYDDFEMENKTKVGHSGDFQNVRIGVYCLVIIIPQPFIVFRFRNAVTSVLCLVYNNIYLLYRMNSLCSVNTHGFHKKTIVVPVPTTLSPFTTVNSYATVANVLSLPYSVTGYLGVSVNIAQTKMIVACSAGVYCYVSANYGTSWTLSTTLSTSGFYCCAFSVDGTRGVAGVQGGYMYFINWSSTTPTLTAFDTTARAYYSVSMTPDGSKINATNAANNFYSSWNGSTYNAFSTGNGMSHIGIGTSPNANTVIMANGWLFQSSTWNGSTWSANVNTGMAGSGCGMCFLGGGQSGTPSYVLIANNGSRNDTSVANSLYLFQWNPSTKQLSNPISVTSDYGGVVNGALTPCGSNGNIVYFINSTTPSSPYVSAITFTVT